MTLMTVANMAYLELLDSLWAMMMSDLLILLELNLSHLFRG
jgi:hypothetical protein